MGKDATQRKCAEPEKDKECEADTTGTYRVLTPTVVYPEGLRLKVKNDNILTEEGKKAVSDGELEGEKVSK